MSEINGPKIGVNQVNFTGVQKFDSENEKEVNKENLQYSDFSDNKAEALGRAMLVKGADDNVNNDLKVLLDNPQIAENSDRMFEKAYEEAQAQNSANPYEIAAEASTASM